MCPWLNNTVLPESVKNARRNERKDEDRNDKRSEKRNPDDAVVVRTGTDRHKIIKANAVLLGR